LGKIRFLFPPLYGVGIFINMKIIISENQYKRIISKITGEGDNSNNNFLNKLKSLIGRKDNEIGNMVLNSVIKGNYKFISFRGDYEVKFFIKYFPFTILRNKPGDYEMILPLFKEKKISINNKILKNIFFEIAKEHMDVSDYVFMVGYESL